MSQAQYTTAQSQITLVLPESIQSIINNLPPNIANQVKSLLQNSQSLAPSSGTTNPLNVVNGNGGGNVLVNTGSVSTVLRVQPPVTLTNTIIRAGAATRSVTTITPTITATLGPTINATPTTVVTTIINNGITMVSTSVISNNANQQPTPTISRVTSTIVNAGVTTITTSLVTAIVSTQSPQQQQTAVVNNNLIGQSSNSLIGQSSNNRVGQSSNNLLAQLSNNVPNQQSVVFRTVTVVNSAPTATNSLINTIISSFFNPFPQSTSVLGLNALPTPLSNGNNLPLINNNINNNASPFQIPSTNLVTTNQLFPTTSQLFPTTNQLLPTTSQLFPTTNQLLPTNNQLFLTNNQVLPTPLIGNNNIPLVQQSLMGGPLSSSPFNSINSNVNNLLATSNFGNFLSTPTALISSLPTSTQLMGSTNPFSTPVLFPTTSSTLAAITPAGTPVAPNFPISSTPLLGALISPATTPLQNILPTPMSLVPSSLNPMIPPIPIPTGTTSTVMIIPPPSSTFTSPSPSPSTSLSPSPSPSPSPPSSSMNMIMSTPSLQTVSRDTMSLNVIANSANIIDDDDANFSQSKKWKVHGWLVIYLMFVLHLVV
ncbi:hypothetical protein HMI55_002325 [Coelomomyces lativittatus]|nr:hypothetical protein HMI55_002325 [Coelomomyces lativittatus]